jgi:predicted nucleotidyltransferase
MGVNKAIDITAKQREILLSLLRSYLPETTVWVFGSRVKFTSRPGSDLDLAAFVTPEQNSRLAALKEALDESDLPFRVDVLDWNSLPENFKRNIEKEYAVLYEAGDGSDEQAK